jgi:hypothetical protein
MEMVLAEKIVTALQRAQASTRWRDYGDIYQLTGHHAFHARDVRQALQAVAEYRGIRLSGLDEALEGFAEIGQPRMGTVAYQTTAHRGLARRVQ